MTSQFYLPVYRLAVFRRKKDINLLTLFCYCCFPESEREKIIVILFIRHFILNTACDTQIDLAVKIFRQELTLAFCAQPGHLQRLQGMELF